MISKNVNRDVFKLLLCQGETVVAEMWKVTRHPYGVRVHGVDLESAGRWGDSFPVELVAWLPKEVHKMLK